MKVFICVLMACIVATTYAQGLSALMGGASTGGATGSSGSMLGGALGRGGGMNQMLYFAALNGNENARMMLTCTMMRMPLWLCLQRMS